jgi:hypothetical protein
MPTGKITKITSDRGGFLVQITGNAEPLVATSPAVQAALLTAFLLPAEVAVELFDNTPAIKRVDAFDVNTKAGNGQISRLATQLNFGQGLNVLEVFVIAGGVEKALQASDDAIQRVCCCAALSKTKVALTLDGTGTEITRVSFPPVD